MDIFIMQHNYRSKYLVVIDGDVYVYKDENCKLVNHSSLFKQKMILLVNRMFVK